MYLEGRGVQQDDTQAVAWYRKAAEQGDASAQQSLGYMYVKGRGVPKITVRQFAGIAKPPNRVT
jgi:TPR repeat protein